MKREEIDALSGPFNQNPKATTRKTRQAVMPKRINESTGYTIYPSHSLGNGKIFNGYASLCDWITEQKVVVIDGYAGVFWDSLQAGIGAELLMRGIQVKWHKAESYLKPEQEIDQMVSPFLGTANSVWGTKARLSLSDFFQTGELEKVEPDRSYEINILIGVGASLAGWEAPVIYVDLPKNELQYRMGAGSITNIGKEIPENQVSMYKRFYFVDWVVLNKHKESILNKMKVLVDAQWENDINWGFSEDLFSGLSKISRSVFRARPWFTPGAWGGQWMKRHFPELNQDEVNYGWSFELIAPENGLVFESDGYLLELSFDFLMYKDYQSVLGKHADQFKTDFPIRFDFLDTFGGGNLSIQCHPSLKYIQDNFGEQITQDETYYILDCTDNASVYLGFHENINKEEFRNDLEESVLKGKEVEIPKYVQKHSSKCHDLFLIPNGTVHSAGANNLVLEISATPYIFTFKMYDWLNVDLDGNPRPINIDHAFNNLIFDRKGERVKEELISKPDILSSGKDWVLYHLPTHRDHFYDVHRVEFETEVFVENKDVCHIMMIVEGSEVEIETADGTKQTFTYAETFVVPAAAENYRMINKGTGVAKIVKAFVKD